MNINTEDILPLVGELAAKYTSKESTSITYEKASQLMEAILYCIREYEDHQPEGEEILAVDHNMDVKTAYQLGYERVLRKVKDTQKQYNEMIENFCSYGNRCYYDTFVKGIPGFFLYYDPRFQPQNHILTLDYPVLSSIEGLCGADAMKVYVNSGYLEQIFLKSIPEEYVRHVLKAYSGDCDDLIINLAAITERNLLGGWIAGKQINTRGYTEKERKRVYAFVNETSRETIEAVCKEGILKLIHYLSPGNMELVKYLMLDIPDFSFELKNAAEHGHLESVLAVK